MWANMVLEIIQQLRALSPCHKMAKEGLDLKSVNGKHA